MRRIRQCLFTFTTLALIATNLAANVTPTCAVVGTGSSAPQVCAKDPPPGAQGTASATVPACNGNTPFVQCGYYYNPTGSGWLSLKSTSYPYGWHSWNGTSTLSTFLDGLSNISFSLTGNAYMYECPANTCANRTLYVNPTQDYGYFLSTPNGASITITFPSPGIKGFTLFWGSVDQWNTITLNAGNTGYTVSGNQLPGFTSYNTTGGTGTTSELVQFTLQSNSDPAWTSVTFSSSVPAFEFDDIEWETACTTNCGVAGPSALAPVPEPCSLMLLGSGLTGVIWRLRRRNPR